MTPPAETMRGIVDSLRQASEVSLSAGSDSVLDLDDASTVTPFPEPEDEDDEEWYIMRTPAILDRLGL